MQLLIMWSLALIGVVACIIATQQEGQWLENRRRLQRDQRIIELEVECLDPVAITIARIDQELANTNRGTS